MSEEHEHHHHHHDDDEECHCHCHDHDHEHGHEHHHEATSIEQAGGCAAGLSGKLTCWNADAEARFTKILMEIGKWVEAESGAMLGHIKAAITLDDGTGITLNLTDLSNGVEKHGNLDPQEKVNFTFMCAVLDVDEHELKHRMFHAIEDSGLDYELNEHVECHCHDHEHHHHHHDDDEECHCHCHDHDHEHGHEHHHHHDDDDDGECHCAECEAKRTKKEEDKKKSFFQRVFGKKA